MLAQQVPYPLFHLPSPFMGMYVYMYLYLQILMCARAHTHTLIIEKRILHSKADFNYRKELKHFFGIRNYKEVIRRRYGQVNRHH